MAHGKPDMDFVTVFQLEAARRGRVNDDQAEEAEGGQEAIGFDDRANSWKPQESRAGIC
jgi:hypothetical protein